ncbi:MAG: hypothetical protein ACTSYO_09445 [Candidatus Ranarchaeia archaeon]
MRPVGQPPRGPGGRGVGGEREAAARRPPGQGAEDVSGAPCGRPRGPGVGGYVSEQAAQGRRVPGHRRVPGDRRDTAYRRTGRSRRRNCKGLWEEGKVKIKRHNLLNHPSA